MGTLLLSLIMGIWSRLSLCFRLLLALVLALAMLCWFKKPHQDNIIKAQGAWIRFTFTSYSQCISKRGQQGAPLALNLLYRSSEASGVVHAAHDNHCPQKAWMLPFMWKFMTIPNFIRPEKYILLMMWKAERQTVGSWIQLEGVWRLFIG